MPVGPIARGGRVAFKSGFGAFWFMPKKMVPVLCRLLASGPQCCAEGDAGIWLMGVYY